MSVDHDVLRSLREREDPRVGVRERFLTPEVDGGKTVAVLAEPSGEAGRTGWLICHSFGLEQDNLQSFEVQLARRLAASGSPVLRYHSQGYGDSELPMEHIDVGSHVRSAVDAAALLREEADVRGIGLIGAKFGGAVAALVAARTGAEALALLEPVINGRSYMRSTIRSALVAGLSGGGRSPVEGERVDPVEAMRRDGSADVHGFPLRRDVYEEISELDVARDMQSYGGRSLVIQVSRSATQRPDIGHLMDRLGTAGGACRAETLVDPNALRFGLPRFRVAGSSRKVDVAADLHEAIIATTVNWCVDVARNDRHDMGAGR